VIRVLIVDDQAAVRQPLAFTLDHQPDITVVGSAASASEARLFLREVDVAIVDLTLQEGAGSQVIAELVEDNPGAAALILTGSGDTEELARGVESGASAVMYKSATLDEIVDAVRRLASGELLLTARAAMDLVHAAARDRARERGAREIAERLTPRERDVLHALADGLSDLEMAERLGLSKETIRTHMTRVMSRLGASSRLQALVIAVRYGLVEIR
jgi:DNA-binding NarL/FixJ family response regulator